MNTQDNLVYKIKVGHIGPIMELDDTLSEEKQNLIFARNGTGKSFLSRAFRYIAEHENHENQENIATWLVSEEAINGVAKLQFLKGDDQLANLNLNSQSGLAEVTLNTNIPTIFHVFSQDFVDTELRQNEYKIDGDITHTITVGSKNIELEESREKLKNTESDHENKKKLLTDAFNKEKESELKNKAGISGGLTEYKNLSIEPYFIQDLPPELTVSDKPLIGFIKQLDSLKSIPADQPLPEEVAPLLLDEIPYTEIKEVLEESISPASIAKNIKDKIDANYDFYKTGKDLIDKNPETCPLCDQSLENEKTKEIIDAYVKYFEDAEAKAKATLKRYLIIINDKIKDITNHEQNINRQENLFNDIKRYIPSQSDITFENRSDDYKKIIDILTEIRDIIKRKEENLSILCIVPDSDLKNILARLNTKIEDINTKISKIRKLLGNTSNERKNLQRLACEAFLTEFIKNNKVAIDDVQYIKSDLEKQNIEIKKLEDVGDKASVKGRVASTLGNLLPYFFGDKYSFDEETFTIKRDGKDMPARGSHRTLSDGEKSVLAFCYFIAMIHLKVQSNDDYKKMFLVFDDPVTSLSYDFIFSVVQVLKNLGISDQGGISMEPRQAQDGFIRPRLLILTHNSYFFNVALNNFIVKTSAAFSLDTSNDGKHKLSKMRDYIAPFKNQLKDIIDVVNGKEPDHTTANSIRSVLDAIHRFCYPDRALNDFFGLIAKERDLSIKSVLINNFSHGHYGELTPTPDDLKQACKEAVEIADVFIPGQTKQLTPK